MTTLGSIREAVRRYPFLLNILRPLVRSAYRCRRLAVHVLNIVYAPMFWVLWHSGGQLRIGSTGQGHTVVMLAVTVLHLDPRVEREARALAAAGYCVIIIWPDQVGSAVTIDWGPGVSFCPLPGRAANFAFHFPGFLGWPMARAAMKHRPLAFHAHDLCTALIGLVAARRTGAHLVCDFHEWYSENVTLDPRSKEYRPHTRVTRNTYRWLERLAYEHASEIVTVCDSIAHDLEKEFGDRRSRVHVIRNIPRLDVVPSRSYGSLKSELGVSPEKCLVLWQGGVGPSRLIEPIVEALACAPDCVLAIRGPGVDDYADDYRAIANRVGAGNRLHILQPVPSSDVVAAAAGADSGIWSLPNLCKNFRYALPNKIFEYLAAGIPVLAADFPEARKLVEGGAVGACFDPYDPASIGAAMQRQADPVIRAQMRSRIPGFLRSISADVEWKKLVAIYDRLSRSDPCRKRDHPPEILVRAAE
jgi:starch synthase